MVECGSIRLAEPTCSTFYIPSYVTTGLHGPNALRAYEQLMTLEIELRESGLVYRCPPGQHDDLAISSALLVWAARHPHLYRWCWALEGPRPPRNKQRPPNALGWT